jgi:hypothetical protein
MEAKVAPDFVVIAIDSFNPPLVTMSIGSSTLLRKDLLLELLAIQP